jgi:hypothetical protein
MLAPQPLPEHKRILRPDGDNQAEPKQQPLNKNAKQTKSNLAGTITLPINRR